MKRSQQSIFWDLEVNIVNAAKRRWLDLLSSPIILPGAATRIGDVADLIKCLRPVAARSPLKRFGKDGDGGYLMPDLLDGVSACISPGVNREVGFDTDIADRGIDVYMADASVDGPPIDHAKFHFTKKFFEIYNSDTTITIDEFCKMAPDQGDWILQMDIEGAEFRVLAATPEHVIAKFRIMVIEFHNLDMLFSRTDFAYMNPVFRRLLQTHQVVHLHPNNYTSVIWHRGLGIPKGLEITFIRNDFINTLGLPERLPHSLDQDNSHKYPPITLPACWIS
jgi:hypothetical protein